MRTTHTILASSLAAIGLLPSAMSAQAEVVTDLVKGLGRGAGEAMITYKGKVYFEGFRADVGRELFVASGPKSVTLVKDLYPGKTGKSVNSGHPQNFCVFGDKLYFRGRFAGVGTELGVSDGTAAGTKLFADLWGGGSSFPNSSSPSSLTVAGSQMFFFARTGSASLSLFVTDGTSKGTTRLKSVGGQGFSTMGRLGSTGSVLFGADGALGVELWISNGTALGTKLLKDLLPGSARGWPNDVTPFGKLALFSAFGAKSKRYLWTSDGTMKGTKLVGHPVIVSGPFTVLGGIAYFKGHLSDNNRELWRTDGTKAGTWRVADVLPGSSGSDPEWMTPVKDKWIYFSAQTFDGRGRELWRSNGTAAGTLQVAEIYPGSKNGTPTGDTGNDHYAVNGDYVYFFAHHRIHGVEPFAIKTTAATSYKEGIGCGGKPTLTTGFPKLGSTVAVTGSRAPTGAAAILAVGLPATTPVSLGSGCLLRVNFAGPVFMTSFKPAGSSWSLSVKVPLDTALTGQILATQAAFANTSPLGLELTNGVRLLLGE